MSTLLLALTWLRSLNDAKIDKWVNSIPSQAVRLIGTLEILGAIGLILPAVTGNLRWLTPIAAVGLVLTMIGAMILHIQRGEFPNLGVNLVFLALAAFVVFGRFFMLPF
jgi:VIT1/CCC1 family predicted Fe2+/Mn2+ transporter